MRGTAGGGAATGLLPGEYCGRRWLPIAGDIALAVGLLVLDAIGTVVALLIGIDYSGWQSFDPRADNSDIHLTPNWLYVGIAGGLILLTAALLYRLRAVVSTCLQVLVAVTVMLIAVAGAQFDEEHGARADASVSAASPGL
ncbi:DUF6234 family protein [Streptomyces sp. TLI_185]|uniref:DUF6234 family protein n=1 Tax=Streptomyces sp. TLI_185 TaxID=2485151 RepID=UPI000F514A5F|nr:DUF6234 family protein [Streptomyces sp. TLI_185]RPF33365.1 hypothetical protein EDD92_3277 [Streptomyces sp. TLI_185]